MDENQLEETLLFLEVCLNNLPEDDERFASVKTHIKSAMDSIEKILRPSTEIQGKTMNFFSPDRIIIDLTSYESSLLSMEQWLDEIGFIYPYQDKLMAHSRSRGEKYDSTNWSEEVWEMIYRSLKDRLC